MSGIDTRSRTEQLEALHRRTKHEIQIAQRAGNTTRVTELNQLRTRLESELGYTPGPKRPARGLPKTRSEKAKNRVTRHLERLGITAHDVKVWALATGRIDAIHRGRLAADLVTAYELAHQHQETDR